MNLDDVTSELGEAYRRWKESEKDKNIARDKFFKEATSALEEEEAEQVVERVNASNAEEAISIANYRYARFRLVDVVDIGDGTYDLILEEDFDLRPFTYINPEDGQVYQRSVMEGAPSLDDERLRSEQPELWEQITHEVTRRELRPLEELTEEQASALRPYLVSPKPKPRLVPPRPAKPDE
jgi:hypothetical protein